MEQSTIEKEHEINPTLSVAVNNTVQADNRSFITANTVECTLPEMRSKHIIPVFLKDNEPVISHVEFIEMMDRTVNEVFQRETISEPSIRVSHPIMGRVPEAKHKPAKELFEWEKTVYYERMAFVIEVPSINDEVDGNKVSLTVGGVKAYNLDNLYNKKGADEHFKIFIGFKNRVCTNLCVWSDGSVLDLKVNSREQLLAGMHSLIQNYNMRGHFQSMQELSNYSLNEHQFAQLMGRCRMYSHLPVGLKKQIPPLFFGDNQLSTVCKDYYREKSFCRDEDGNINLWKLYNLFTGACKNSYIDSFIERNTNAFSFANELKLALQNQAFNWYLS